MLESNSERKWKEEEHLETWVWAGALVVGWFSTLGSLQSDLAFLLLSRCSEVFPSIPDFVLGVGLCTVQVWGSGKRTDRGITLMPAPAAIFTATSFRSLSDLINLLVTLVSTNSCLFYKNIGKGQTCKGKRFWGLYLRVLCFSHCSESR